MHDSGTTILKRDSLGRIGYLLEQREALLDEFDCSGLKGAAFARTVGICYATFANWMQKRRHARKRWTASSRARRSRRSRRPRS